MYTGSDAKAGMGIKVKSFIFSTTLSAENLD